MATSGGANPWLNIQACIHGLTTDRGLMLNGKLCKISGYNGTKERFICEVDGEDFPFLCKEANLAFMDFPDDSKMKLVAARDSKARASVVPDPEVPTILIVKGDTFDYQGKYLLQAERHDGKAVWKCEHIPRYINYHSLGYWLLGTFGPISPPADDIIHGEDGKDGGRQVLGGFPVSESGWVQGFHFRARSFADTPDLIPISRWEEWRPESNNMSDDFGNFGWHPTRQVVIQSMIPGRPKPLLQVEVRKNDYLGDNNFPGDEAWINSCLLERATSFSGEYVLQSWMACDLPVWKCSGIPDEYLKDVPFEEWEIFRPKLLQYSSKEQAWLLSWMDVADEYLYAKSAPQLPEIVDVRAWRMVSPGYRQIFYPCDFRVYVQQPESSMLEKREDDFSWENSDSDESEQQSSFRKDEILKGVPPQLMFSDRASKVEFCLQSQLHHQHPVWKSTSGGSWSNSWMYYDRHQNFWVVGGEAIGDRFARYRVKSWSPFPHSMPDSAHNPRVCWEESCKNAHGQMCWLPKPDTHIVIFEVPSEDGQRCQIPTNVPIITPTSEAAESDSYFSVEEEDEDKDQEKHPEEDQEEKKDEEQMRFTLITYSRSPQRFREALLSGPELEGCRKELEESGFSVELPSGAHVFVRPNHYEAVMSNLKSYDLKPRHVVVAEEFECSLTAAIQSLPSKEQVRPKGDKIELLLNSGGAASSDNPCSSAMASSRASQKKKRKFRPVYEVKRTFIHVSVPSSSFSGPSSRLKTASTSDANPRVVVSPRYRKLDNRELKHFAVQAHSDQCGPVDLGDVCAGRTTCSAAEKARWIRKINEKDTSIMHLIPSAPDRVRADKEIMLAVICRPGPAYSDLLMYSPLKLRADRDFIMRCVEWDAGVLDYTTEELKNDFQLVLHAATHDGGNTLRFADPKFRSNIRVVVAALKSNPDCLTYVSPSLMRHRDVLPFWPEWKKEQEHFAQWG